MFRILVVEDDANAQKLMKIILKQNGYDVLTAENGEDALHVLETEQADLIILDVMMPKMDGYQLTECLREAGDNTPILMITAKQLSVDRCKGFRAGTDDYMVKPVDEEEMLLRIKALLRRSQIANEHILHIGKVTLEYDSLTVTREGISQMIPRKEFYLLYKLLSYPNKIFTRIQLMNEIWGVDSDTIDTTINVHINRLRKRFGEWPEFEIVAIRGIGYKAVIHHEEI